MMDELMISFFLIAGSLLILIAAIGIFRLPDVYMRIHAATKATSLGLMLILIALMIYLPLLSVIIKSIIIILFLYITIPLSSGLLGKSSLDMNIPRWKREEKEDVDNT